MNKIFIGCLIAYISFDLGHDYYLQDLDYFALTEKQAMTEWYLKLGRDVGLFVGASMAIITESMGSE